MEIGKEFPLPPEYREMCYDLLASDKPIRPFQVPEDQSSRGLPVSRPPPRETRVLAGCCWLRAGKGAPPAGDVPPARREKPVPADSLLPRPLPLVQRCGLQR